VETRIEHLVKLALEEDLGDLGDITSHATIPAEQIIHAKITAKQPGVIAGLDIVGEVYHQVDPKVTVRQCLEDSDPVKVGTVVCEIDGAGRSVLMGERVTLNFLQRLSGIATLTAQFVEAVADYQAVILDTRKTTPGFRALEKYAVRMGGGSNHRIGLYDMVLIKDNHIDAAGSITAAVNAVRTNLDARDLPIEVEVKTLEELDEALACKVNRILLDNMGLDQMRAAVIRGAGRIPLEASGNMSLDRVRAVAETGVNFISVGALTHSAPVLDLSMRLMVDG